MSSDAWTSRRTPLTLSVITENPLQRHIENLNDWLCETPMSRGPIPADNAALLLSQNYCSSIRPLCSLLQEGATS